MTALPRVLVIHPGQVVDNDAIDYPYFTGLPAAGLVRILRRAGFTAHLLDAFAWPDAGYRALRAGRGLYGAPCAALLESLRDARFDAAVVHVTPYHIATLPDAGLQHLITTLRRLRPQAMLIGAELYVGGMHRLPAPAEALRAAYPELDHFVALEGEESIPELLQGATTSEFFIEGRAISATTLSHTGPPAWSPEQLAHFAAFLERLSPLPKLRQYRVDGRTLPIAFSRGCPFNCAFCSNPYQNYRAVPLPVIAKWLTWASAQGVTRLFALDDAANVRPDFADLLRLLDSHGFQVDFPNGLRADLLDEARVQALARVSGQLSISAESAAARLQKDVIGKSVHLAHIERVAAWCQQAQLPLSIHWLLALPGETREETLITLSAARRLLDSHKAIPLVQYATPLPGTQLASDAQGHAPLGMAMQHEPTFLPEGVEKAELHAAVDLLRQRSLEARTAKVIINLTYRCNNHCQFCAVGNRLQQDLDLDTVKEVLERYAARGITLLDLDGGEPTLHPDLFDIIAYARQIGFATINITTNGRRLAYPDFTRKLLASGITSLLISLHGADAVVHDAITGTPGSFKETMAGIENVLAMRSEELDFGINTTLGKPNYHLLEALVERLSALGVTKFNIQFLTPFGRAAAQLLPPQEAAAAVVKKTIERFGDAMQIQVINLPFCALPGLERHVAQDLGKLSREMVFVTREEVNLYQYLAHTRSPGEACASCLFAIGCDGMYDFSEVHD
jgi:MoaA/NifB/PqqE/SkfB family radical SAM enzyme